MTKPGKYAGSPVMPIEDYNRQQVQLRKISEYIQQIQELSKEVENLKKAISEISSK
jgi:UDP-3-O-[3-hydroxymyristoyl] glucosamine N-acyltransferase